MAVGEEGEGLEEVEYGGCGFLGRLDDTVG